MMGILEASAEELSSMQEEMTQVNPGSTYVEDSGIDSIVDGIAEMAVDDFRRVPTDEVSVTEDSSAIVDSWHEHIDVLVAHPQSTLTLAQLRQKFPHGKYWNHANNPGASNSVNNQDGYTSTPCPKHNGYCGTSRQTCNGFQPGGTQLSWQCMGYAEKLGYDTTGYNPRLNANGWNTVWNSSALDSLKPGDIVRYKNDGHSIFVTGVSGDTVTFTDCNNSGNCNIRWDATISKATLRSTFSYVRVSPGIANGDSCNCSEGYAGNYVVTTNSSPLTIRSGHGTGYSSIGSIPKGATCYVSKSDGTWAHVEYNGINGFASMQYLTRAASNPAWVRVNYSSIHLRVPSDDKRTVTVSCGGDLPNSYRISFSHTGSFSAGFVGEWYGDCCHDCEITGTEATSGTITYSLVNADNNVTVATCTLDVSVDTDPTTISFSNTDVRIDMPSQTTATVRVSADGYRPAGGFYKFVDHTGECFNYSWDGNTGDGGTNILITGLKAGTGSLTVAAIKDDKELDRGTIYITVTSPPSISASVSSVSLEIPSHSEQTVTLEAGGTRPFSHNMVWSINGSGFTCEWVGDWYNDKHDLKVIGTGVGSGTVTVYLRNSETDEYVASTSFTVDVSVASHTVYYSANGGSGGPTSFEKTYGVSTRLSSQMPEWFGHTYRGWSKDRNAESREYTPGSNFNDDTVSTLYAVWEEPRQRTMPCSMVTTISPVGSKSYEKIIASSSGRYTLSSTGDEDTVAYLYSSDGTLLSYDDDSGEGRNFSITYYFDSNAVYYLCPGYYNADLGLIHTDAIKIIDVESVSLNKSSMTLEEGSSETLIATVVPSDAEDRDVQWRSNNASVATVDGNGRVTAVSAGTATISAETNNGKRASCTVTVVPRVVEISSVTLNKASLSLVKGTSETLIATISPSNATNKTIVWSSSNTAVATVNSSGRVTAVDAGTATITATSSNGKSASCRVTVVTETYTVTFNANGGTGAPSPQQKEKDKTLTLSSAVPSKTFLVSYNANGGTVSPASKNISCTFSNWNTLQNGSGRSYNPGGSYTDNADVTLYAQWTNPKAGDLAVPTRSGYSFEGWYTSSSGGTQVNKNTTISGSITLYAHWTSYDPYNLGDETYSFKNYGDSDSPYGHCFGMSITSSGYHNGNLDINKIGGNADTSLYSFSRTSTVKAPICYYQNIQGSSSSRSIVAGGSTYLTGNSDISSDWNAVVNYVKNHDYDGSGLLQIGFRKNSHGGHAINFLRYESVNGQDRIYAYDNNFPNDEVYFYRDSSGRVWETPKQTFSGSIDCIALRDIRTYYSLAGSFDISHALYAPVNSTQVQGYTYTYMEGGLSGEEYVMYEIPKTVGQVKIIPKVDCADFIYMDTEYSFGEIKEGTYGLLTFAKMGENGMETEEKFQIYNEPEKLAVTSQPEDVYAKNGETAATAVVAAGDGLTYQWYLKNKNATSFTKSNVTGSRYSVKMSDSVDGRQVYCVVSDKHGNSVTTRTAMLNKHIELSIANQPQDSYVANGEKAATTVVARGNDLTYRWYVKDSTATKFTKSSITKSTYSVTMSDTVDGRQVYCIVTDRFGNTVTSKTATLRKLMQLGITTQPKDSYAANGEKATAKVVATGNGLAYQWYVKNKTASKFSKSSVTKSAYSVTMSDSIDGRQVYCVVTDVFGNSVKSKTATLSKYIPVSIATQPKDAYVANGKTATVTVTANGSGLKYQWYLKNKGSSSFSKSSITTNAYSATMSDNIDGRKVYCVITDAKGKSVTSKTVSLNKYVALSITSQPKDCTVAKGEKASVSVTAVGTNLKYQWYLKNKGSSTFSKSSVTSSAYSVTMSDSADGRQVYCVVTDQKGNSVTSRTVTLKQSLPLSITSQPKDCYAYNGEKATATVKAKGSGLKYQWYIKNKNATKFSISSVTVSTYSVAMSDSVDGRQVYCIVTDQKGNTVISKTATLHKYVPLNIVSLPQNAKVANGAKASTTVKANGSGLTYQWYLKNKNAKSFTKSSVTSNTYSVTMSDSVDGRQVYCVITDAKGVTVQTNAVTLSKK